MTPVLTGLVPIYTATQQQCMLLQCPSLLKVKREDDPTSIPL
jgi:hypothetical protein